MRYERASEEDPGRAAHAGGRRVGEAGSRQNVVGILDGKPRGYAPGMGRKL